MEKDTVGSVFDDTEKYFILSRLVNDLDRNMDVIALSIFDNFNDLYSSVPSLSFRNTSFSEGDIFYEKLAKIIHDYTGKLKWVLFKVPGSSSYVIIPEIFLKKENVNFDVKLSYLVYSNITFQEIFNGIATERYPVFDKSSFIDLFSKEKFNTIINLIINDNVQLARCIEKEWSTALTRPDL